MKARSAESVFYSTVRVIHVVAIRSFLLLNDVPFYEFTETYPFYCSWTFGLFSV